jgi:hypothetical protein
MYAHVRYAPNGHAPEKGGRIQEAQDPHWGRYDELRSLGSVEYEIKFE